MDHRRTRRAAIVVGTALLGAIVTVVFLIDRDPYAAHRQATEQPIPGALGYSLQPPPAGTRPELSPSEVRARYPADGGEVQVAFASLRDTLQGRSIGPGWVLFARGVCLRNAKGELVSDARGNDPLDLDCTDATVWVLAVDATTAEPLVALTGYDETGSWAPDLVG
jgi:hypothetical protein